MIRIIPEYLRGRCYKCNVLLEVEYSDFKEKSIPERGYDSTYRYLTCPTCGAELYPTNFKPTKGEE